jgi:plasmid stabilization system protein ParE
MNVRFTPEAQAQADECDTWWRQHRTARELFARELAGVKELLLANPKLGTVYAIVDGKPIRKVLMPKSRHHLYYAADFETDVIMIHAVWGAPREGGPDL